MNDLPEHISIWGELADTDHELRHVDVRGVRTRVLRAGSGPDLVLLHGTGGHLEAYARDIAGLAADFRVTVYDMVGHGWSDLPDRPYTIDVLADHLADALHQAAMQLTLDQFVTDDVAAIVGGDVIEEFKFAGIGIDLDFSNVCATRKSAGEIDGGVGVERVVRLRPLLLDQRP